MTVEIWTKRQQADTEDRQMQSPRTFMALFEPGPINDSSQLESVLAYCGDDLTGDDEGMSGDKLFGRMANARWEQE